MTSLRAKLNVGAVCGKHDSTAPAGLRLSFDSLYKAIFGAVFQFSMCRPATEKDGATMGASDLAAFITNTGSGRTRAKIGAAFAAFPFWDAIWKRSALSQFRMVSPELYISPGMAWRTKRDQVAKSIGLLVVTEQVKRRFMVYGQAGRAVATILACVIVSLARRSSLGIPVNAPIFSMTAEPRRIVLAGKTSLSPFAVTLLGAEVASSYRRQHSLEILFTFKASDLGTLIGATFPSTSLILAITPLATKMALGKTLDIGFGEVFIAALFASQNDHAAIIRRQWSISNGNHFAKS